MEPSGKCLPQAVRRGTGVLHLFALRDLDDGRVAQGIVEFLSGFVQDALVACEVVDDRAGRAIKYTPSANEGTNSRLD